MADAKVLDHNISTILTRMLLLDKHVQDWDENRHTCVVSWDSVRLAFLIAQLNGLDIMTCDFWNAYLNAPCREKEWFKGGLDTGEDRGNSPHHKGTLRTQEFWCFLAFHSCYYYPQQFRLSRHTSGPGCVALPRAQMGRHTTNCAWCTWTTSYWLVMTWSHRYFRLGRYMSWKKGH